MIYKVGLSGATGRIGSEICGLLSDEFTVSGDLFELADALAKDKQIKHIDGVDVRVPGEPSREPVHLWIDFSVPAACMKLLEEAKSPVVIGTTGFTSAELESIESYAKRYPVLLASNMSSGMNVVLNLLSHLPKSANFPCGVVLEESHHIHKKDSPSGTAVTMLKVLKSRGFENVDVHVTRAGNIKGYHSVRLITDDEEIVISHRAETRTTFARGALWAGHFLLKQKTPRVYTMTDVFSAEE